MTYKEVFCKNVKDLRTLNKLSKTKMATKLGISIRTLNIIENGDLPTRLSLKIICAIMENFNVNPADLFK